MKTIIVTGANGGLGLWTTKYLLDLNYFVIMACRDIEKTQKAIAAFPEFDTNKQYVIKQLDLLDFDNIKRFVNGLTDFKEIYAVDCNAGITYNGQFRFAENGIEETFGTNHLGHFLLINLLLEKYALENIVIIASELHNPENKSPFAKAVFKPIEELAHPAVNPAITLSKQNESFYATSKLCNILFGYELDRRLKNRKQKTCVNSINPGFMPETNFGRSHKRFEKFTRKVLKIVGTVLGFVDTPEVSAKAVVALLQQNTISGKYFNKFKEIPSSADSYNTAFSKTLWEGSEMLTGATFLNNPA